MVCDLFLKSYPADYRFAEYLCRSIDKFCHGFRRLIIVAPDDQCPRPNLPTAIVVQPEHSPTYLGQQAQKLYADTHTDADFILHVDSDCVFVRDVQPQSFIQNGKPIWLMTKWEHLDEATKAAWLGPMTKFAGYAPALEGMRRHPVLWPRWFYSVLRGFCIGKHGQTLWDYVMTQPDRAFSEFNCAFAVAHCWHQDRFTFLDTHQDEFPPDYVKQFWSYDGPEKHRAEIERLLA